MLISVIEHVRGKSQACDFREYRRDLQHDLFSQAKTVSGLIKECRNNIINGNGTKKFGRLFERLNFYHPLWHVKIRSSSCIRVPNIRRLLCCIGILLLQKYVASTSQGTSFKRSPLSKCASVNRQLIESFKNRFPERTDDAAFFLGCTRFTVTIWSHSCTSSICLENIRLDAHTVYEM